MKKIICSISVFVWLGCSGGEKKSKELNRLILFPLTTVTYEQSEQIDLAHATYLIHYIDRKDTLVHFTLTESDRAFLLNLLNLMQVDSSKNESRSYLGTCMIMPEVLTTIVIEFPHAATRLVVDGSCREFARDEREKVGAIKDFLKGLDEIIKMKSEILNAPKSNIIYL